MGQVQSLLIHLSSTPNGRVSSQQDLPVFQELQLHSHLSLESGSGMVSKGTQAGYPTSDKTRLYWTGGVRLPPLNKKSGKIKFVAWKLSGLGGHKLENCPLGLLRLFSRAGRRTLKSIMDWGSDIGPNTAREISWTKHPRLQQPNQLLAI